MNMHVMILLEPAYKIFHTSVKFKRRTISVTPYTRNEAAAMSDYFPQADSAIPIPAMKLSSLREARYARACPNIDRSRTLGGLNARGRGLASHPAPPLDIPKYRRYHCPIDLGSRFRHNQEWNASRLIVDANSPNCRVALLALCVIRESGHSHVLIASSQCA
jgi:hypothetical protein